MIRLVLSEAEAAVLRDVLVEASQRAALAVLEKLDNAEEEE